MMYNGNLEFSLISYNKLNWNKLKLVNEVENLWTLPKGEKKHYEGYHQPKKNFTIKIKVVNNWNEPLFLFITSSSTCRCDPTLL